MKITNYLFTVVIIISSVQFAFSQGYIQQTSGVDMTFHCIYFINESTGYAAGGGGYGQMVSKTTNGGDVWITVRNVNAYPIHAMHFANENTGWCIGPSGTAIRTQNGGANWTQMSVILYNLYGIYFINEATGWIVGEAPVNTNTYIIKTTNGGNNWIPVHNNLHVDLIKVFFLDELNGSATDNKGGIYKTSDGGHNWIKQTEQNIYQRINSIRLADANTGWAVGSEGLILRTSNGGTNWEIIPSGTTDDLSSINFIDNIKGWIAGDDATILSTTNGGLNWSFQNTSLEPDIYLRDIHFINENTGWAAGEDGKIIKTTTGGSVSVTLTSTEVPDGFRIFNNYPNPFNPVTKIKFEIPQASRVKLTVYNSVGQEVAEILNSKLTAGTFEAIFDGSNLASGIYFYTLEAGRFIESKNMMLIK